MENDGEGDLQRDTERENKIVQRLAPFSPRENGVSRRKGVWMHEMCQLGCFGLLHIPEHLVAEEEVDTVPGGDDGGRPSLAPKHSVEIGLIEHKQIGCASGEGVVAAAADLIVQ